MSQAEYSIRCDDMRFNEVKKNYRSERVLYTKSRLAAGCLSILP